MLVKIFCFAAFAGLFFQIVSLSAFWVMFKKWGKSTQPDKSAPLSYWTLYFLQNVDIAFCTLIWVGCFMMMTRKGSMYMRKKFDDDAHAPNSESVWTPRFLFVNGIGFHLGALSGSYGILAIVDVTLGMPVSLWPLLCSLLVDVGICWLTIKCFDWWIGHSIRHDDDPEGDQEEDSFFI